MRMKLRFPAAFAVVAVAASLTAPALAPASAQDPGQWLSPPGDTPRPGAGPGHGLGSGETTYSLDTLFSGLKIAPDEASAKAIEDRIWALWLASGSDTCTLLMTRVKDATDDKNYDLAIKLLDAVIAIKPDYVEAWNRRATVYYLKQDYGHSLADLREVLAREPRHFGALSGLGLILQDIGDDKDALEAYRKALAIDPHLENIPEVVKTLSEKVEGRSI
jgi:tetratricopeptide (TPR) repeat protein